MANAVEIARREGIALDAGDWEQVWSLLDKYAEPIYLYAIANVDAQLVKFGKSVSPGARLKDLQTSNGRELKIFGYCRHESPMTEKEVHAKLWAHHASGEWFLLNDATREVIGQMRAKAGLQ